jgi:hypothetical protein
MEHPASALATPLMFARRCSGTSRHHRHSERLALERFRFTGRSFGIGSFTFELVRSADDVHPTVLDVGKGAVTCRRGRIAVWAMGPNVDPKLPAPQSYAQTCQLVSSWCTQGANAGSVPESLRRPLALPAITPGSPCPTSAARQVDNGQFGGVALGDDPVR